MFWKRKNQKGPPQPTIQVFVRHAIYSSVSARKERFPHFSRETCHRNLLATSDSRVHITHLLDTAHDGTHFLNNYIEIKAGSEGKSFLCLLDHVSNLDLHPDTIVYFLEDDYLHRPGWVDILLEGFSTGADYVTLYDHNDKYTSYPKLTSKIFATPSCHWRTTPSTTNTYAMRLSTLQEHLPIHRKFSTGREITADHDKFCALAKKGAILISSMPGWSTHAEPKYASPITNWGAIFKESLCKHSR